jgi:hypothetical protein
MKRISRVNSIAAVSCLVTTVWTSQIAQGQEPASPEAGWAAMLKCAEISDEKRRHECTDDVLRNAGVLAPAEGARRKRFGLQRAEKPAEDPKQRQAEDKLDVTLATVEKGGDGKLMLTTTENAVWRQVESDAVRPMPTPGQSMKIEKTSFGGFMCETAKAVAFRCYRAR